MKVGGHGRGPGNEWETPAHGGDAAAAAATPAPVGDPHERPPLGRRAAFLALGFAGTLLVALGLAGQLPLFLLSGVEVWPLLVLATLASLASCHAWARAATLAWLLVSMAMLAILAIGLGLAAAIAPSLALFTAGKAAAFAAGHGATIVRTVLPIVALMPVCGLASLVWTWRPVRVAATRLLRIDPDDVRHTTALVFLTDLTLTSFGLLAWLHGRPPLLTIVAAETSQLGSGHAVSGSHALLSLVYQLLWTAPLALVSAGLFTRRTWRQTLARLAIGVPTPSQLGIGLGAGLLLLGLSGSTGLAIHGLWNLMQWPQTNTATFDHLLGSAMSPAGAVVIGVTAGLGEEISVRGLLQPRFGLIGSNLVFASAHAYQYGPDALLSVFILGLALGLLRTRWNTTVSALAHGSYDGIAVLATALHG